MVGTFIHMRDCQIANLGNETPILGFSSRQERNKFVLGLLFPIGGYVPSSLEFSIRKRKEVPESETCYLRLNCQIFKGLPGNLLGGCEAPVFSCSYCGDVVVDDSVIQ